MEKCEHVYGYLDEVYEILFIYSKEELAKRQAEDSEYVTKYWYCPDCGEKL